MAGAYSVNKVILVGNIGGDPELKYTTSGTSVTNFSLATNEKWQDVNGSPKEEISWHKIVVWGKQAEFAHKYLSKGTKIFVEGRLTYRKWTTQSGENRISAEIIAKELVILSSKGNNQNQDTQNRPQNNNNYKDESPLPPSVEDDNDVPF